HRRTDVFRQRTEMKKFLATLCMMLLMTVAAMAAGQVKTPNCNYCGGGSPNLTYPNYGLWQTGVGGEFTLIVVSGTDIDLAAYSSGAKNQGVPPTVNSFQTFCVEDNE